MTNNRKQYLIVASFIILLVTAFIISMISGRYAISLSSAFALLKAFITGADISNNQELLNISTVLIDIRLPRALAAIVIGAALGVSGTMLQSIFANPLVSPGIMGVLAGSSFGAAFGIITFSSWAMVQLSSFTFGMTSVFLALFIARIYKSSTTLLLVLGGMISNAFFNALLSIVKLAADPNDELASITFWLMGTLAMVDSGSIMIKAGIPLFTATIFACFFGKVLNTLSMGDDEAKSLGINAVTYRILMLMLATFLSCMTVTIAGQIGFVGLVIPHICRMIIGPNNRILLPFSAIAGALFLLAADTLVRNIFPADLPLGIITSIIGLCVFTLVLKNSGKGWR